MMARRLPVSLVCAFAACGGSSADPPASVVRDSAGIRVVESHRPAVADSVAWYLDESPVLDLTSTPSGASHEFFMVSGATRLSDGSIVVAELGTGAVRTFSPEGILMAQAGAVGDGPGEYRQLNAVHSFRGDSLVAFDRWLGRATVLSGDLELGRTIQFPAPYATELFVLRDATFVVLFSFPSLLEYEGTGGVNRTPVPVVRYSSTGEAVDTVDVLPGYEELMIPDRTGEGWGSMRLTFGKRSFVGTSDDAVVLANSDEMSFDVRSPSGTMIQAVVVPNWDQSVTPEMIEAETYAFVPDDAPPEVLRRVEERAAIEPTPTTRPAFESLRVTRDGHVWLASTKGRAGYYDATRWEVFSPEGVWVGALTTPERFTVHEVGPDYILGVRLDDLDVEHVQLLRLTARSSALPDEGD